VSSGFEPTEFCGFGEKKNESQKKAVKRVGIPKKNYLCIAEATFGMSKPQVCVGDRLGR
jgi:hypothetical protein